MTCLQVLLIIIELALGLIDYMHAGVVRVSLAHKCALCWQCDIIGD